MERDNLNYLFMCISMFVLTTPHPAIAQLDYENVQWEQVNEISTHGHEFMNNSIMPQIDPFKPVSVGNIGPYSVPGYVGSYQSLFGMTSYMTDFKQFARDTSDSFGKVLRAGAGRLSQLTAEDDMLTQADINYRTELRRKQRMARFAGNEQEYPNRLPYYQHRSGIITVDRHNVEGSRSSSEKWRQLSSAMDEYVHEKNTPGDRVEMMFNSRYEKMAYDNLLETMNANIRRNAQEIEGQQIQIAQIEQQIRDIDEQMYFTNLTIENLRAKRQELETRLNELNDSISGSRREIEGLRVEIDQLNEGIAAEQAKLEALQRQQASATQMQAALGAITLAGNVASMSQAMSASSRSARRTEVYQDTWSYVPSSSSSTTSQGSKSVASASGGSSEIDAQKAYWDNWSEQHNAKNKAYIESAMQARGISNGDKIRTYRQSNYGTVSQMQKNKLGY